jgi:hypothetical protein
VPSRGRAARLAIAITTLAFLSLAQLSQAKLVVNGFGTPAFGPQAYGGQFAGFGNLDTSPLGVAVNTSGNGAPSGTSYVVNGSEGNRLERFSPDGSFQRLWGKDVIAPFVNETQRLVVNANGGTYTLTFKGDTTDPILFDSEASDIDEALNALPSIGSDANVTVSGNSNDVGIFFITFTGSLTASEQPQISVGAGQLIGTAEIVTLADGTSSTASTGTGFEICTVVSQCQKALISTTANGGELNHPQGVAVNQANGHVYVTESGNRRVSEFDADGNFVRAWGWDVIANGEPNDTGTGFEICKVGSECQEGAAGANGGQFGDEIGYPVTDSSNDVWVPDPSNRRIQEFNSSGGFIAAYGYDTDALGGGGALEKCTSVTPGACQVGTAGSGAGQFALGSPSQITFDSTGNLYAIDSANSRVLKFDPTLTTAADFGDGAFAAYTTLAPQNLTAIQGGGRLAFSVINDISAGRERQIVELDPTDASVKDTSLVGAGIETAIGGLGAGNAGSLYLTIKADFVGGKRAVPPRQVLVLGDTPPPNPVVVLKSVETKTDTTATFDATVDPQGDLVSCTFQYSTDQSNWTDAPAGGCDSLAQSGGAQTVSQGIIGLIPNTHYFLRLQVSRPLLASSTVTTNVASFDTDSVPPVVTDVGAIQVSDTSVRLVGTIDPRHSATHYVFEYGATLALGSSTPPLDIGAGATPLTISQVVEGLGKDTSYYYRLVATNLIGPSVSASKTFHTRTAPLPDPENRGWEMVSPPDKNYTGAQNRAVYEGTNAGVSPGGNAVGFCTTALFGEPPGRMTAFCAPYIAKRGAGGWQTTHPFPEYCYTDPISGIGGFKLTVYPNMDYSRFVVGKGESAGCPIPPLSPVAPLRPATDGGGITQNLYFEDPTTEPFSYDLMSPKLSYEAYPPRVVGGSDDFSHVIYMVDSNQTAEPDSPPPAKFTKLYDWEQPGRGACAQPSGCLNLVTKNTNNEPFTTDSKIPAYDTAGSTIPIGTAVSNSGDRVFFANQTGGEEIGYGGVCSKAGCEVYMRENAATTFDVSASECTLGPAACGSPETKADSFVSAIPSGEKAFFLSCAKLTDASSPEGACEGTAEGVIGVSGSKLYRWDRNAAPGQRLIDLTIDHEPSDGVQPNGGIKPFAGGLIGASDAGDTAFFTLQGQIVSGASTGPTEKLYRWRYNAGKPTVDYLGPYQGVRDSNGADPDLYGEYHNVTPDGKYVLIFSRLALNPAADRDTDTDIYRWGEQDGWICLSCQLPGVPSAGDVDLESVDLGAATLDPSFRSFRPEPLISDDGQRVFFGTPDALVSQDVNGQVSCPVVDTYFFDVKIKSCFDVYEWHDGTVSLISSGTGNEPTRLIGTTPSGDDVFFYTSQRLVGWDVDNSVDIYNSRVGGGFPEPPAQPSSCEGESCRNAGTSAPASNGAGTAAFNGPGNPMPKHQRARKHHKKRHHKRAHHRAASNNRRVGR